MGKSSGGIRNTRPNGNRENQEDRLESALEPFRKIALSAKDENDFIKKARAITNLPSTVSEYFQNKYSIDENSSIQQTSRNYISIVKDREKAISTGKKLFSNFSLKGLTQKKLQDNIHQRAKNVRAYEDGIKDKNRSEADKNRLRKQLKAEKERLNFYSSLVRLI